MTMPLIPLFFITWITGFVGWVLIYLRFLGRFFYSPNPYALPLSILQLIPAFLAAFFLLRRYLLQPARSSLMWLFLALGFLFLPVADAISILDSGTETTGLVVGSRLLHILGYGAAFLAIFSFVSRSSGFSRLRFQIDLLIHSASWGLLLWFMVVEPILQPLLPNASVRFWVALYAILDLIILMLILWQQGQARKPEPFLWWLAVGFFLLGAYDLVSGWFYLQAGANTLLWAGYLSHAGYGAISLSALVYKLPATTADVVSPRETRWGHARTRWQLVEARWLPMVSSVALITFFLVSWQQYGQVDPVLAWSALCLCLLLVLREGIIAGQSTLSGYAVLLDNIADPAFICNETGNLLLRNSSLRSLVPPTARSKRLPVLLPVQPEWPELLSRARMQGWQGEVWVFSQQKPKFAAWLLLQPIPGEEGTEPRFACLLHDLTPQHQQEETLRAAYQQAEDARQGLQSLSESLEDRVREQTADLAKALEQLEEQNRLLRSLDQMKSEFVALTSHELRTPLAGIRAGLELLLLQKQTLDERTANVLQIVQKESERLSRLVESILDLTALEAGKMPLQIAPLEVPRLLESVRVAVATSRGSFRTEELERLTIEHAEGLPDIMADEHLLASVLLQLVDNSYKYAPGANIQIRTEAENAFVRITVKDDGPGIPAKDRDRLFQSFSRLESADSPRTRGMGIGLYLSRKMVEAMEGRMELGTEETGFSVHLRMRAAAEEA